MNPRLAIALVVVGLLGLFALQNMDRLTVRFLVWSFEIPQAILIVACGALGLVIGWLLGAISGRKSGD